MSVKITSGEIRFGEPKGSMIIVSTPQELPDDSNYWYKIYRDSDFMVGLR